MYLLYVVVETALDETQPWHAPIGVEGRQGRYYAGLVSKSCEWSRFMSQDTGPESEQVTSGLSDLEGLSSTHPDWFRQALAVPRREHSIPVDKGYIHGFSWGQPGKPAVLFSHGMMAHARCWAFIAPLLAEHFHLAAFDTSGMGDSSWHESYGYDQRAAEARAFAEALAMDRPHLVCHSFGGSVGLTTIETYPDAFRSLTVCDMTMLRPEDGDAFMARRKEGPGIAKPRKAHRVYPDLPSAMARFRLAPEQPCANDFLFEYMAYHSLKKVEGGYCWKFDPAVLQPDRSKDEEFWLTLAPRFIDLAAPKAIVHGALSELFQSDISDYMREQTNYETPVVAINDAHHHLMLDQPLALAATLNALLQTF